MISRRRPVDPPTAGRPDGEQGSALIEFVLLAVVVIVPLLYLVLAAFEMQRASFAVTQAAREAGRAFATADDVPSGLVRADYAVRLAMDGQGLDPGDTTISYARPGVGCSTGAGGTAAASLEPGASFMICVCRSVALPGVPGAFDGGRNTVTGAYLVQVEAYRSR